MKKWRFKEGEVRCHDCGRVLKKGESVVSYDLEDQGKGTFYKCNDCYEKNETLENFQNCEVYARIVGYIRPVSQWNAGKAEEFCDRKEFVIAEK